MIRVDEFLDRTFVPGYKCLDFVREVWLDAFGEDIGARLANIADAVHAKHLMLSVVKEFTRLDTPRDPCFVMMLRPGCTPHVGIFVRGRVLHLSYPQAEYQPLETASRGFSQVRFYA